MELDDFTTSRVLFYEFSHVFSPISNINHLLTLPNLN